MIIGAWRSLVAHLHGVQGVGGSNPLAPILNCRLVCADYRRDKSFLVMSSCLSCLSQISHDYRLYIEKTWGCIFRQLSGQYTLPVVTGQLENGA